MTHATTPGPGRSPSLRERNRARTYADIAGAALELFDGNGFDSTTVEQIATAAGVSQATFFRYFGTKEDVLFSDEAGSTATLIELVGNRSDPSPTVAALAEPLLAYAESMTGPGSPHSRRMTRLVM